MRKLLLVLAAGAAIAGCAQKSTPVADQPEAATTADAPPAAPPPAASNAATPAELDRAAAATQESADAADAETTPSDATLDRMVPMPQAAKLPDGRWKAGTHYVPMNPAQATTVGPGEVEVIEFLWLACGACYQLNERVTAWESKLPSYVKFRREHVMWGPSHRLLGKLLYTLEALGRSDLVAVAFNEIHRKGNMLVEADEAKTQAAQLAFAKANGIAEADFLREYKGFAVTTRLQRADELTRRYRVEHTPVFVVNGKYVTDGGMAGSGEDLIKLLNDLIAAEKR
jgi:thiol:disulfide interchange protein DsbA